MVLTLHTSAFSPPGVAVEILARKLNIDIERKLLDMVNAEHKKPAFMKVLNDL